MQQSDTIKYKAFNSEVQIPRHPQRVMDVADLLALLQLHDEDLFTNHAKMECLLGDVRCYT
ncbi:hypothetical protein [Paenibacillus farraposensis]|uniref:hypothetical protein n=1 Tax=Paenibacillus farraposensis TaxID=2807095 RepID=UPI00366AC386